MWRAFELVHATFKSGAELYLEDMLPALDNFVQYGAPQIIEKPEYVQALYEMVTDMFADGKIGGVDRICACKLAEAMMLSLRGHIDNCVHGFINAAMGVLANQPVLGKSYKVHLMEMVINAIYYNPILSLQVLESQGWTNKFFSLWFSSMSSFTRVHDKQLCILAIIALLSIKPEQVPPSIAVGWPRLLQGIKILFDTLPEAMRSKFASVQFVGLVIDLNADREEALKDDFQFDSGTYGYEESDDEWDDDDANWTGGDNDAEPVTEAKDESTAYLEFLNEEVRPSYGAYVHVPWDFMGTYGRKSKFHKLADMHQNQAQKLKADEAEESDDELGEDSVLLESPLDKIDPYLAFRDAFKSKEDPVLSVLKQEHLSANVTQGWKPSNLSSALRCCLISQPRSVRRSLRYAVGQTPRTCLACRALSRFRGHVWLRTAQASWPNFIEQLPDLCNSQGSSSASLTCISLVSAEVHGRCCHIGHRTQRRDGVPPHQHFHADHPGMSQGSSACTLDDQ